MSARMTRAVVTGSFLLDSALAPGLAAAQTTPPSQGARPAGQPRLAGGAVGAGSRGEAWVASQLPTLREHLSQGQNWSATVLSASK
jgi:hypothetical protein